MGGCFKKDFKDTIARSNNSKSKFHISYENNLLNMGLQNSKRKSLKMILKNYIPKCLNHLKSQLNLC